MGSTEETVTRRRRRDNARTALPAPRRQRGTNRDTTPQPALHSVPSSFRIARARLAPALSLVLWLLYVVTVVVTVVRGDAFGDAVQLLTTMIFLLSVTLLTLSACLYLVARAGALPRFAEHRRARRIVIDEQFASQKPGLVALLPSHAEDPALVRMSLWSVALQEYPGLRVVLLLDDDPHTVDPVKRASLNECRALADEVMEQLRPLRTRVEAASAAVDSGELSATASAGIVMREHAAAAQWLRAQADAAPRSTHIEVFFRDQVLRRLAADLDGTALALHDALENGEEPLTDLRARQIMARLVNIVSVDASVFERKRYETLSHAPNKAMNLNSYLGLLGGRFREQGAGDRLSLVHIGEASEAAPAGESAGAGENGARASSPGILEVPDTDYVLTLDADSMLLPEYCLRLVHVLEQPENSRIAVAQTPYSSYRGAPTRLERLAGATTDLQHIVHQGLTAYDATFWVGANAILRRSALEDIRTETIEDGHRIVRFISDRTVIEDTESSIDIALHGWSLLNYPERLSYSATPSDFGSLVIQRRRWADGGLLILPRLHELIGLRRLQGTPMRWGQRLLRLNYLGSITWVTLGLIAVLTLYPLNGQLVTVLLLLIVVPYFVEMASDLRYLGYRRLDMVGIYGLNLLLLSVNLVGSIASVAQALTGRKARFVTTPKVSTRVPAPALYIVAPLVVMGGATAVAVRAGFDGAWGTTGFASFTALATAWGIIRLVGVRHAITDLVLGWLNWIWVEVPTVAETAPSTSPRWARVLDDGHLDRVGVAL
ncbi:glycosyltransferase family 2 protein [Subtercola boreus]|nr:glycosyltransferase family 2 protein [Subtercola boreus]TQL53214.1 glycosyl transferase family 2 [Subtercola boreus]